MKYLIPFLLLFLYACSGGGNKPDVSTIEVNMPVERFEQDFFKIDTNDVAGSLAHLRNAYPHFFPTFMQDILQLNPMDPASIGIIKQIVGSYSSLADSLAPTYKNFDNIRDDIADGMRFVKYYYPQYRVPKLLTFVGTLDAPGMVLTNEYLAVGLQQFAGKSFGGYQLPEVQQMYPTYISRRFDKEYIPVNALKAVVDDVYPDQSTGKPLVEQMIEKGKQWYLLDHFLPDTHDTLKTGYTKKQLDWLEQNEGNAWGYIVKNENLYSIEPPVVQAYIGESPFTRGMPEVSPGNIGQWFGWQIVQAFAQKNKELTLQQVLETAPRTIFEGAKYKPK
ncbi:gliding motility lipoprotein GldB [Pseudocnuella soli]|uniref:gliding motility lipoprotein GldB n=1 Tax=Pseudocnuella soli TaxID=2502779 RepID=UPI001049ADA8|nr:hypothetical protein [Pseudocnuella soli]